MESARMLHELVLLRYVRLLHFPTYVSLTGDGGGGGRTGGGARMAGTSGMVDSGCGRVQVQLYKCFETLRFNNRVAVRLRESVPPLLECVQALARQTTVTKVIIYIYIYYICICMVSVPLFLSARICAPQEERLTLVTLLINFCYSRCSRYSLTLFTLLTSMSSVSSVSSVSRWVASWI